MVTRVLLLLLVLTGLPTPGRADTGDELNLSDLIQTFSEDFDALDVSAWGPGTRWIAHTPWNGDFGSAAFADPKPGFPFPGWFDATPGRSQSRVDLALAYVFRPTLSQPRDYREGGAPVSRRHPSPLS